MTNCGNHFMKSVALETGVSDFHKLITSVMKCHYVKSRPKTIFYRDYKNFDQDNFNRELKEAIQSTKQA